MVSLDFTFVLFTLTFVVFLFAMKVLFFDAVQAVIEKRNAAIKKNLEKANKVKVELEGQFKDHDPNQILNQAKSQATSYIEKVLAEANANRDELLKNRELELKEKMDKQVQASMAELKSLEANLQNQVADLVELMVSTISSETRSAIKTTVKS